jgi:hypothetical protein
LIVFVSVWLSGCNPKPVPEVVLEPEPEKSAEIKHGYADSGGVEIHCAETGEPSLTDALCDLRHKNFPPASPGRTSV